ncbi:MAG: hypothetical protein ABR911_02495 [Syntrophales bacterium]|jgi:hypothetical protein
MWKNLEILRSLGECTMLSAATRPVGMGWNPSIRKEIEGRGYRVELREEAISSQNWQQLAGVAYASFCKGLGLERAFGHSNPYHRYAFPEAWWRSRTQSADLAVVNYSYWSWLPCRCPKVVVLLDLWSDFMWEGPRREIEDLKTADLVIVISKTEEEKLNRWGIARTLWSPPAVPASEFSDSTEIGLLGSKSRVNCEGLEWLERFLSSSSANIRVYGSLAEQANHPSFIRCGRYEKQTTPYEACGIILMTTSQGMGVQIKTIEALAAGRAIVARPGAMRGLPLSQAAWIEAQSPAEMMARAHELKNNPDMRHRQYHNARDYYHRFLNSNMILEQLREAYLKVAEQGRLAAKQEFVNAGTGE